MGDCQLFEMAAKRTNSENRGNIIADAAVGSAAVAMPVAIIIILTTIQGLSRHGLPNHPHFGL